MTPEQKQTLKKRGVVALSAFAALASFYGATMEGLDAHNVNKRIQREWPGVADTPAVRGDAWSASLASPFLRAPDWRQVDRSARWAEIASDRAGPGEIDDSTHWSRVRIGRVGEPVELDIQGEVGRLPADTVDIGGTRLVRDSRGSHSEHDSHYVMRRALFLHDAPSAAIVSGTTVEKNPADDGWGDSHPAMKTEKHSAGHMGDRPDGSNPHGATAPARIVAPAVPGQSQVAWAYVASTRLNAQGERSVMLESGYAPLSVVQAARAQTKKSDAESTAAILLGLLGAAIGAFSVYKVFRALDDSSRAQLHRRLAAKRNGSSFDAGVRAGMAPDAASASKASPKSWMRR